MILMFVGKHCDTTAWAAVHGEQGAPRVKSHPLLFLNGGDEAAAGPEVE